MSLEYAWWKSLKCHSNNFFSVYIFIYLSLCWYFLFNGNLAAMLFFFFFFKWDCVFKIFIYYRNAYNWNKHKEFWGSAFLFCRVHTCCSFACLIYSVVKLQHFRQCIVANLNTVSALSPKLGGLLSLCAWSFIEWWRSTVSYFTEMSFPAMSCFKCCSSEGMDTITLGWLVFWKPFFYWLLLWLISWLAYFLWYHVKDRDKVY